MSNILKGIQLNEVSPHDYDSDWDYQDALARSGRPRSSYRSQEDDTFDSDVAYSRKIYQATKAAKEKAQRDADHNRLASGMNEEQLDELSPETLASYKKKASAAATQADKQGDYKLGNKRFSGIVKATKKQFAHDEKNLKEFAADDGEGGEEDTLRKYAKLWYNGNLGTQQQVEQILDRMGWEIGELESEEGGAFVVQAGDENGDTYIGFTANDLTDNLDENLHKWFKEKWVRFGPDGKIRGACARGDDSEGKPKCLPQSKAHSLGKKGRASAAARKRREDPNPERSGKAINVNTKKKSNESVVLGRDEGNFAGDTPVNLGGVVVKNLGIGDIVSYLGQKAKILAMSKTGNTSRIHIPSSMGGVTKDVLTKDLKRTSLSEEELDEACWKGYHKEGNKKMFGKTYPNCVKNEGVAEEHHSESCPHCGGEMVSEELMNEKKDACYYKVKSRYKVWPSAYASGALVKCRKKGASNWGNGGKSNESVTEGESIDARIANLKDAIRFETPRSIPGEHPEDQYTRHAEKIAGYKAELKKLVAQKKQGVAEDQLDEKWSQKYKDSINCSNPKGFSQKAHCAGKQKNESAIMSGLNQLDEGWKEKLGAAALAGSMALGAGAAHSRVTPDGQGGFTGGLKPTATVNAPSDNKPSTEAPSGFSKEYLQKAADPNRTGRYMISVEKAQELLKNMP